MSRRDPPVPPWTGLQQRGRYESVLQPNPCVGRYRIMQLGGSGWLVGGYTLTTTAGLDSTDKSAVRSGAGAIKLERCRGCKVRERSGPSGAMVGT